MEAFSEKGDGRRVKQRGVKLTGCLLLGLLWIPSEFLLNVIS
jgi:hypothetical protein